MQYYNKIKIYIKARLLMEKKLFLTLLVTGTLSAMTLDETIQKALLHNNTLKKIALDVDVAKANRKSKKAQNYGRIDFLASYDHYNNARTLAPLTPMDIAGTPDGSYKIPTTNDLMNAGVAYNVVLFNGFAQLNSYKISDILYKNSLIKSKLTKAEVIYNVRTLYLSLLSLDEQLEAQKSFTLSQKRLYEKVKLAYELGSKSKLDTLKAKNSYELARSNEDKTAANIEILRATLTSMIGGENFKDEKPITIDITQSVDNRQQSDIKKLNRYKLATLQSEVAKKKLSTAYAAYYPKVDLSAYYGYSFGPNATTNHSPVSDITYLNEGDYNDKVNWQVGIHLKWNLYDFGSKSALVEKEKVALLSSKLAEQDVALEIDKNLKIAKSKLSLALSTYSAALSEYELLKEITKAEEIKYDNNASTLTDLLDFRSKEAVAYAKMISSKYEFQKAKYYIDYLLERGEK
jgi:outer membrane protein TolC